MKCILVVMTLLLAACSTTKNADGSTQVTLHLASAMQNLQQSLLPSASVAPVTPKAMPPAPASQAWSDKELKNFQKLFECRSGVDNELLQASLKKIGGFDSFTFNLPIKVFGHTPSKLTLFYSGEGIYRTYVKGQTEAALAKSAGIKKTKDGYYKSFDWSYLKVDTYEGTYYECNVNFERY